MKSLCEYCGNGFNNKPLYMDEDSTIQLDDENNLDIDYEERFGWESMYYRKNIQINNCPMCGRKLIQENDSECSSNTEEIIQERIKEYSALGSIAKVEAYLDCLDIIKQP